MPSIALGSSSVVFAAPLSTFPRYRVGPQGLPCARSGSCVNMNIREPLYTFTSSSERPDWLETTPAQLPALSPSASRGIRSKRVPLSRHHRSALAPITRNAASDQLTDATRPRGFAPPRRSTHPRLPGLLHPGACRGSQRFSVPPSAPARPTRKWSQPWSGNDEPSSLRPSHPSKKSPRQQPYSRRREPLPPRRCTDIARDDDARPRGLAPLPGP